MTILLTRPLKPAAPSLTAAEFAESYSGHRAELVAGTPTETPVPGFDHGRTCLLLTRYLDRFIDGNGLGRLVVNDTFVQTRRGPDTVRGPDLAFYSYTRLPRGTKVPSVPDVPPELVAEVKSPSDTWSLMFTKVGEYLATGVAAVVIVDGESRTASVYVDGAVQRTYRDGEDLVVPEALPGFAVAVALLFDT